MMKPMKPAELPPVDGDIESSIETSSVQDDFAKPKDSRKSFRDRSLLIVIIIIIINSLFSVDKLKYIIRIIQKI